MTSSCGPGSTRARPAFELADIVRAFGEALVKSRVLLPEQRAALRAIEQCRTASLGGHLDVCTACGFERPSYNSCRNRHCPKCQSLAQARWIQGRLERLLPTHYFHVVFTLPSELRAVARRSREALFDILFASASQTLLRLGRDPERLGAELGVTMVLHTWTRDLRLHPHVHAIVTGGGLSDDGERWVGARREFLFPVRVMGALFRGKMLAALEQAHARGKLDLSKVDLGALRKKAWVVYAKRPFGGPEQVIRYLGQYTHRVGISNHRLFSFDEKGVTIGTKDGKSVSLTGVALLARFIEHVLPPRFVKIRHYGLHSASHSTTRLALARARLSLKVGSSPPPPSPRKETPDWRETLLAITGSTPAYVPVAISRPSFEPPLPAHRPAAERRRRRHDVGTEHSKRTVAL